MFEKILNYMIFTFLISFVIMIRPYQESDIDQLVDIYNYHVENGIATLDLKPITSKRLAVQFAKIQKKYPFLVEEDKGTIRAYAYASQWKAKSGYDRTVETTIYGNPQHQGKGVGTSIYRHLIKILKEQSYHSVVACLSLPNAPSVALHEKLGFIKVAHFQNLAVKFNKPIDVGYWQLVLD